MTYKKSIISLATVMALSGTALADGSATYLPLNTVANDRAWVMFGVNDFSNGVSSSTLATIGAFTADFDVVTDDPTDTLATEGFLSSDGKKMGSVQGVLNSSGGPYFTELKVGLKSSDLEFSETSPLRSMYISIEGTDSVAKIKLNYKAGLEGREVEV